MVDRQQQMTAANNIVAKVPPDGAVLLVTIIPSTNFHQFFVSPLKEVDTFSTENAIYDGHSIYIGKYD